MAKRAMGLRGFTSSGLRVSGEDFRVWELWCRVWEAAVVMAKRAIG